MTEEPMQTTPEGRKRKSLGLPGEGGEEIPVPSRDRVMDALRRAAKLGQIKRPDGREPGTEEQS